MKARLPAPFVLGALLLLAGGLAAAVVTRRAPSVPASSCDGSYSESLQLQATRVREIEQSARARFTYLVRNTAKYECPYFGSDGKLHRRTVEAVEHGTAFAYEQSGNDTYLLTNEHVATWPEVTGPNHKVDGVSEGCKRVDERLRIVHDEHDEYEPGHVALVRVATDPLLDAAVLKANQKLTTLPYRIGRSAGVRQGTAVQVRGFPLGLMHAVNTGKVVNPYDRDQEQGWDHVDFVIDALLSEGNSGSPVLALSCTTGELELVGMYHAGYKGHSALNVVVGVDQLREFMTKKRRVQRPRGDANPAAQAATRKRLRDALAGGALPWFQLGALPVLVELSKGDTFHVHVHRRDFPLDDRRLLTFEERPGPEGHGQLTTLWVPRASGGLQAWEEGQLGTDDRDLLARAAELLREQMTRTLAYRRAVSPDATADERRRGRDIQRSIERGAQSARELTQGLADLAERLAASRPGNLDAGATPALATPAGSK